MGSVVVVDHEAVVFGATEWSQSKLSSLFDDELLSMPMMTSYRGFRSWVFGQEKVN